MPAVAEREQLSVPGARAGDSAAWDAIIRRYQLPLYAYVFELVHEEAGSLDIVQETFISAVRNIGSLRDDTKLGSWLFGIAHQKCIQRWRSRSREDAALEAMAQVCAEFDAAPDELLIRVEQEAEFMKRVGRLSLAHRSVLLLHFVEDFSLEEIGSITGAAVGTVKSRLHYAKQSLRKLLEAGEL